MNNDLISRGALKETIRKRLCVSSLEYLTEQEKVIVEEIDNAPTVNLEKTSFMKGYNYGCDDGKRFYERPQGEWKHMTVGNTNIEFIICSNCSCGCPSYSYIKEGETEEKVQLCETTFCPNCGAKMKKAVRDEQ